MAMVRAINKAVQCSDTMMEMLNDNMVEVMESETEKELETIALELAVQQDALMKATRAKQPYDDVADAIEDLRERKQQALTKKAEEEGQKIRIEEMKRFLRELGQELTDYDEQMVRKYIERITVYDNHYEVEFKARIKVEIEK